MSNYVKQTIQKEMDNILAQLNCAKEDMDLHKRQVEKHERKYRELLEDYDALTDFLNGG